MFDAIEPRCSIEAMDGSFRAVALALKLASSGRNFASSFSSWKNNPDLWMLIPSGLIGRTTQMGSFLTIADRGAERRWSNA
jgi:hypothetical protein